MMTVMKSRLTISKRMKIINNIDSLQSLINNYLVANISNDISQDTLNDSMSYSLLAGGKRLRPSLTLATFQIFNDQLSDDVIKAACAVELLHTYSLIHDDLPAMDNDDLRRGVATNHVKFGAGMATLAGDGLLTLAFQWVADNQLDDHIVRQLVIEFSKAAGPAGMVAGQAADILGEHQQLTINQLQVLHSNKTGALLRYATIAGGIIADVDQNTLKLLAKFGEIFGLAFQIYDDLMDVIGTTAQMGKQVHKDHDEHKNTYPELLGIDGTKKALSRALGDAVGTKEELIKQTGRSFDIYDQFLNYFKF